MKKKTHTEAQRHGDQFLCALVAPCENAKSDFQKWSGLPKHSGLKRMKHERLSYQHFP